ncbi:zinc knuckle [Paramuricea clavata]|uniref:Zinc knuckle n=1 Tax=Paramuricea clavata TaxID=317549 RepID=A0A7D9LIN8_PARCT|nr:zinc knuckle [Paramuricea clavata]
MSVHNSERNGNDDASNTQEKGPLSNVEDAFTPYNFKAPFASYSIAEIGRLVEPIKLVENIDEKLKQAKELVDDLDRNVMVIQSSWNEDFVSYGPPLLHIVISLEDIVEEVRTKSSNKKTGSTLHNSSRCLNQVSKLRDSIRELGKITRHPIHQTNHEEPDLETQRLNDEVEFDLDEALLQNPHTTSTPDALTPQVQALLNQRNTDVGSRQINPEPQFKSRVQAGIPGLRSTPFDFRRGGTFQRETPFPPACDLYGLQLPKAWKLPIKPLSSHLAIDINNLQKANAILRFSGDIRDYMNWRASFLETVHYKVNESAARKITALSNMLPDEVFVKISRGQAYSADGYVARLNNLEKDFGDESKLYNVVWSNLTKAPYVGNLKQTNNVELFVRTFDEFVNHAKMLKFGHDDKLVYSIVSNKFDEDIVLKFQAHARLTGVEVNASNFRNWVDDKLQDVLSLRAGQMRLSLRGETRFSDRKSNFQPSTQVSSGQRSASKKTTFGDIFVADTSIKCSICSKDGHLVENCKTFLKAPIKERMRLIRTNQLCFSCLKKGHLASACTEAKKCFCGRDHHPRLHRDVNGKVQNVKAFVAMEAEEYDTEGETSDSDLEADPDGVTHQD